MVRPMKEEYFEVLLEDIRGKVEAVLEVVTPLLPLPEAVNRLEVRMERVDGRLIVIESVLQDHSKVLAEHTKILAGHSQQLTGIEARLKSTDELLTRHVNNPKAHAA